MNSDDRWAARIGPVEWVLAARGIAGTRHVHRKLSVTVEVSAVCGRVIMMFGRAFHDLPVGLEHSDGLLDPRPPWLDRALACGAQTSRPRMPAR